MYNNYYRQDLFQTFERSAAISVRNHLNVPLKRINVKLTHGDFGTPAPNMIGANSSGYFTVNNYGLANFFGPEGSVTYIAQGPIKGQNNVKIIIYWEHPLGPTKSIYTATSNPSGLIRYTLNPPADVIEGWHQRLTIEIFES